MTRMTLLAVTSCALVAGCSQNDINLPSDGPPPIAGGTLHVTRDGSWAIASDPARASIHIVDLDRRQQTARIDLGPEDEPGRIVEDLDGGIHVVLRRAGELATVDLAAGVVRNRRTICNAPRGIEVDPDDGDLVVACAEGELVWLRPEGDVVHRVKLRPDLRDVVAQGDGILWVSTFRSAEILIVDGDRIVDELRLPGGTSASNPMRPTVAYRMRSRPAGGAVIVHQQSQSSQLGSISRPGAVYYGGDCDFGVVRSVVTRIGTDLGMESIALDETSLAVDVVEGAGITVAAASEAGQPFDDGAYVQRNGVRAVLESDRTGFGSRCRGTIDPLNRARAATAVAAMPDGRLVAQYRDPAELVIGDTSITLDGGSVEHFGHALFHEGAGTGVSCASCHPEGAEDGHVWLFDIGARRTQTLTGGILSTAPFHWGGDVPDVTHVLDGTFVGRMAGFMPRQDEIDSFAHWMDALPATPGPTEDASAVARGRDAFESAGCAGCHSGEQRTNNATIPVGPGVGFQVPALYEVVYHAPYLHDGSADTLEQLIDGHEGGGALSDTRRDDLATYLRSL